MNAVKILLSRFMRKLILFILLVIVTLKMQAQLTYQQLVVQFDSGWTYQNLQLIPVKFRGAAAGGLLELMLPKQFITLPQGMQSGKVKVKEFVTKGDADVHILSIRNNSNKALLIHSGELIAGGKQDRMIGETKIIPAGKEEQFATVYCVEEGRWDVKAKPFSHGGSADMELRKTMDITQRQVDIWKQIQQQFRTQNIKSSTSPYLQLDRELLKADSAYTSFFNRKMAETDSSFAGFLAITGDKILGTELFVTPSLFNNAWESMLAMFIRTAITRGDKPQVTKQAQQVFMDALLETEISQRKTLLTMGKAYKYNNQIIGFIAYGF